MASCDDRAAVCQQIEEVARSGQAFTVTINWSKQKHIHQSGCELAVHVNIRERIIFGSTTTMVSSLSGFIPELLHSIDQCL